jgi:uncharacterized membrane protein
MQSTQNSVRLVDEETVQGEVSLARENNSYPGRYPFPFGKTYLFPFACKGIGRVDPSRMTWVESTLSSMMIGPFVVMHIRAERMIAAPIERKESTAMMTGYGWDGGIMLLMGVCALLGIVLLVVLAWTLMRWRIHTTPISMPLYSDMPGSASPALNILRQQYAGGEMDAATYEQRRKHLDRPSERQPTQRT